MAELEDLFQGWRPRNGEKRACISFLARMDDVERHCNAEEGPSGMVASSQDRVQKTFRTDATMDDPARHGWVLLATGCKAGRLGGVKADRCIDEVARPCGIDVVAAVWRRGHQCHKPSRGVGASWRVAEVSAQE